MPNVPNDAFGTLGVSNASFGTSKVPSRTFGELRNQPVAKRKLDRLSSTVEKLARTSAPLKTCSWHGPRLPAWLVHP